MQPFERLSQTLYHIKMEESYSYIFKMSTERSVVVALVH